MESQSLLQALAEFILNDVKRQRSNRAVEQLKEFDVVLRHNEHYNRLLVLLEKRSKIVAGLRHLLPDYILTHSDPASGDMILTVRPRVEKTQRSKDASNPLASQFDIPLAYSSV